MLLIVVFAGIAVAGGVLWLAFRDDVAGIVGAFLFYGFVVVLLSCLLCLGINRAEARTNALSIEAARRTVIAARSSDVSEYELAALQASVMEYNTWLADAQYWQKHPWFGVFTPAYVQDIEPIRSDECPLVFPLWMCILLVIGGGRK